MENYNLIAKTFAGLESVLAEEIKNSGGHHITQGRRAVFYKGNLELIYKSNFFLRTALRILKEINHFEFNNVDQFYLKCKKINWEKYLNHHHRFAVKSTVVHSKEFRNTMFASLKVKDAIVDYFRQKTGKRPDVDTQNPEIIIHAHISQNKCSLSIDSSGESLHKRGYRAYPGEAPLSEVLAAGMILLTGWKGDTDFIDPMCGSGTLPIEAAMIARNTPPGRFRKTFAFMNWCDYNPTIFQNIKKAYQEKTFANKIYASDISDENVLSAKTNARRARVFSNIVFQTCDMKDLKTNTNNAVLVINPPYGERIKHQNIDELYNMVGERLKHKFAGNIAWILTSSRQYLKNVGLKPTKKIELYNGALQCQFVCFPLFKGKKNQ